MPENAMSSSAAGIKVNAHRRAGSIRSARRRVRFRDRVKEKNPVFLAPLRTPLKW